ncbi:MAG: FprA family A-type flavoprotein, partial [Faecalibacterium prausnitzii]|nr:FprA family A-type flavoprotein [Faecalibacterium prausnitzii]
VVTHMEPDHSGSLMRIAQEYPEMKIVGNAKTFTIIKQFFGTGALSEDRMLEVGEGSTISLGSHRLRFLLAPMVHWPEVMTAYEETEKILFSADAFGRFGSLERTARAPWAPQARRYYYNIVGKYGAQVQALLKKISALEIKTICPLHGPVLTEGLEKCLRLYDLWSQWEPEESESILIAHASIHGNTAHAAKTLEGKLEKKGVQVNICDLTVTDLSYAVASAFYCGKLVLACSTYDGGLFPPMKAFLDHLQTKGFRNRRIGLMENVSWAPAAARQMRAELEKMKELRLCETEVLLCGALNQTSEAQMDALVEELCAE